jgi:hypothetical protein
MGNGYQKIVGGARTGRLAFGTTALWRGLDHLLLIERDGYTENYKRFHFTDIESITIRQTKSHITYSIVCLVFVVFFTWIAVITTGPGQVFSLFWVVFFLTPLIFNLAWGPTCVAHISTAVQREELPLRRVRKARRILEAVKATVASAQGVLEPDVSRAQYQFRYAPAPLAPPPLPRDSSMAPPTPPPPVIEAPPEIPPPISAPPPPAPPEIPPPG